MKIEFNPHFKDDECVLYCGKQAYTNLNGRKDIKNKTPYRHTWYIRVLRRGTHRHYYVNLRNGRATLKSLQSYATRFCDYDEAFSIANAVMDSGNVLNAEIVEIIEFQYVEDD